MVLVHLNRFVKNTFGFSAKQTGTFQFPEKTTIHGVEYELTGVFVHNGSVYGGHYYCFLRPTAENKWFKFDDELAVASADPQKEVFEENFGGNNLYTSHAYMLAYVRSDHIAGGQVLINVADTPIPQHLLDRFREADDADHKSHLVQAEFLLWMEVRVATVESFLTHDQSKLGIVDFDTVSRYRVKNNTPLAEFKQVVERDFNLPAERQRYWHWVRRENLTYRPSEPIRRDDEVQDICQLTNDTVWNVFVEDMEETALAPGVTRGDQNVLLLVKFYDPTQLEPIRFVGAVLVRPTNLLQDIVPACQQLIGIEGPMIIFEEVSPHLVQELPRQSRVQDCLQTGDILILQQNSSGAHTARPPLCSAWIRQLADQIIVNFLPHPDSPHPSPIPAGSPAISLPLYGSMSHRDVAAAFATALSGAVSGPVNPDHVRFTGYNPLLQRHRAAPYLLSHGLCLRDLLTYHFGAPHPTLYFEVVPFSMAAYEEQKPLILEWAAAPGKRYEILVPKHETVRQLLALFCSRHPHDALTPDRVSLAEIRVRDGSLREILPDTPVAVISSSSFYRVSPLSS